MNNNDSTLFVTKVTSHTPQTLTKKYSLTETGLSIETSAHLTKGAIETVAVKSAEEFKQILLALSSNEALTFGVAPQKNAKLYSQQILNNLQDTNAIARTKEFFSWSQGPGILLIDYDPREGEQALNREELLSLLASVLPEIKKSSYVCWYSSSSFIYNGEQQINGVRGQRVYLFVRNANDIERAGKVFFERLWLAGHGYFVISKTGALLERSVIDASVWQPTRLDFAAGARCMPPLIQKRGVPSVHEGALLDTEQFLPDLTATEKETLRVLKAKQSELINSEKNKIKEQYIESKAQELLEHSKLLLSDENLEDARNTVSRAVNGGFLTGEFIITLSDKTRITVEQLLDNPEFYDERCTLDPLEPEYDNNKVVGKLFLKGQTPTLHSFARGGRTFFLCRKPLHIEHKRGLTNETTSKALEVLGKRSDVFDLGSELVVIENGEVYTQNSENFSFWLANAMQFFSIVQKGALCVSLVVA